MRLGRIFGLGLAVAVSAAGAVGAQTSDGYKQAVTCSGLLTAAGVYLEGEAKRTGDSESADNAVYVLKLAKRWVGKAIALAQDASTTMDDVTAQTKRFDGKFDNITTEGDFQQLVGSDLDRCLEGGKALPEG